MKTRVRTAKWGLAAAAAGIFSQAAVAETCTLELKKLPDSSRRGYSSRATEEQLLRMCSSQHFWHQSGVERPDDPAAAFAKIVKKHPEKYRCESPFRAVAKLGSEQYAFVLDSTDIKKKGYDRLLFDINHNGDLTDDKVVEARIGEGYEGEGSRQREFPRVDVRVDVEGTTIEYAFFFSVYARWYKDGERERQYLSASLSAGAYREGKLSLNGKDRRIILLDYNSNGRFDDEFKVDGSIRSSNNALYPTSGDMLLIDPDVKRSDYWWDITANDDRHMLSRLVNYDGCYYDLKIAPSGERLTLTASPAPLGLVTNPNDNYRAVLYSDKGVIKISGSRDKAVAVPEGDWKLLNYRIDKTKRKDAATRPAAGEEPKDKKKGSLFARLTRIVVGNSSEDEERTEPLRYTLVSASGTSDYKAVQVRKDKTVEVPFGPPYKPAVKVDYKRGDREVQLDMALVGSAGEVCTDMMVNGNRPGDPTFVIAAPDGEIVERGTFEYG